MSTTSYIHLFRVLALRVISAAKVADYLPIGVKMRSEQNYLVLEVMLMGRADFMRVLVSVVEIDPGVLYLTLFAETADPDTGYVTSSRRINDCLLDLTKPAQVDLVIQLKP